MVFPEKEWPSRNGRVEFHLNGGTTKIRIWAGGRHQFAIPTAKIPVELLQLAAWLSLRLDPQKWWIVEGPGEPGPYIERWIAKQKDLKSNALHTSDK